MVSPYEMYLIMMCWLVSGVRCAGRDDVTTAAAAVTVPFPREYTDLAPGAGTGHGAAALAADRCVRAAAVCIVAVQPVRAARQNLSTSFRGSSEQGSEEKPAGSRFAVRHGPRLESRFSCVPLEFIGCLGNPTENFALLGTPRTAGRFDRCNHLGKCIATQVPPYAMLCFAFEQALQLNDGECRIEQRLQYRKTAWPDRRRRQQDNVLERVPDLKCPRADIVRKRELVELGNVQREIRDTGMRDGSLERDVSRE